jgi:hypothetical protein
MMEATGRAGRQGPGGKRGRGVALVGEVVGDAEGGETLQGKDG